jgi:uncharacterized protein YutE (UPF0331/DUF86 family)
VNDIALNKKESIERCVAQARLYYGQLGSISFDKDYMRRDAIALNIQRACEQCIDLANHAIRALRLGLPKESRESFRLLAEGGIITPELAARMKRMVGFRNILVHEYQELDVGLLIDIIENRLDDLLEFMDCVVMKLG